MMSDPLILKAVHFASIKHRNHRRKDLASSPYINHPIAVALCIAETGKVDDAEVIAAALLHDTIEDTDTSAEELEERFGHRVRSIVEEVTDDKRLRKEKRKRLQVEYAHNLSPAATLVKLADKIANASDIAEAPPAGWDLHQRLEYLNWAEEVIARCPKVNQALEKRFTEVLKSVRLRLAKGIYTGTGS